MYFQNVPFKLVDLSATLQVLVTVLDISLVIYLFFFFFRWRKSSNPLHETMNPCKYHHEAEDTPSDLIRR